MSAVETNDSVVELEEVDDFQFKALFNDSLPEMYIDQPEPLGNNTGPNPEQLLAAAAGYCLAASLKFALAKFKQETGQIKTQAKAIPGRNEEGRLRILGINVDITLGKPAATFSYLDRALDQFENFCTVAGSIDKAIPIKVIVKDSDGKILKAG